MDIFIGICYGLIVAFLSISIGFRIGCALYSEGNNNILKDIKSKLKRIKSSCNHYEFSPVEDLDEWKLKGFGKLEWKQTFRGSRWECTKCGKKIKIRKRMHETYPEDMPEEGKFL